MEKNILKLLEEDARLTVAQLAVMLDADKNEVKNTIDKRVSVKGFNTLNT